MTWSTNCSLQNCGPRPTGPIWPHPPLNTNHNPQLPMHCDMLHEDLYVQGYACNTTCQAEPEVQGKVYFLRSKIFPNLKSVPVNCSTRVLFTFSILVQVQCDCLRRVMGLTFPQPCKWVTKTMEGNSTDCASVPESLPQFDWQCDPRNETCADGKLNRQVHHLSHLRAPVKQKNALTWNIIHLFSSSRSIRRAHHLRVPRVHTTANWGTRTRNCRRGSKRQQYRLWRFWVWWWWDTRGRKRDVFKSLSLVPFDHHVHIERTF